MEPSIVALAGPNGAGKSTTGPALVRDTLGVTEYVDADVLARLSGGSPWAAGRVMLGQLRGLARARHSFAFETTLASRSFAPWIANLKSQGWSFHLVFLSLAGADLAVARVADRVRHGGHDVPEEVVRRRYQASYRNFLALYEPLASSWSMFDTSQGAPQWLGEGGGGALADRPRLQTQLLKQSGEALRVHQKSGLPLAIWREGRVAWVSPDEFERGLRAAAP